MKAIHFSRKALLVFLLIGCSIDPKNGYGIVGEWRLYERGGSPGAGYYTVAIPANPLQSLTFRSDGQIYKQGDEANTLFKDASRYRVDSTQNGLALWTKSKKKDSDEFFYHIQFQGDTLILSPSCFEGCHFGLVRIR
jgi:hypothetical protein